MPDKTVLRSYRDEINAYLVNKLLPFWFDRSKDQESGGLITHFARHGNDSGENEKSLIAQTRMLYSFSNVFRSGYGSMCKEFAKHGLDFLVNRMRDHRNGGFFRLVNRRGDILIGDKILFSRATFLLTSFFFIFN